MKFMIFFALLFACAAFPQSFTPDVKAEEDTAAIIALATEAARADAPDDVFKQKEDLSKLTESLTKGIAASAASAAAAATAAANEAAVFTQNNDKSKWTESLKKSISAFATAPAAAVDNNAAFFTQNNDLSKWTESIIKIIATSASSAASAATTAGNDAAVFAGKDVLFKWPESLTESITNSAASTASAVKAAANNAALFTKKDDQSIWTATLLPNFLAGLPKAIAQLGDTAENKEAISNLLRVFRTVIASADPKIPNQIDNDQGNSAAINFPQPILKNLFAPNILKSLSGLFSQVDDTAAGQAPMADFGKMILKMMKSFED